MDIMYSGIAQSLLMSLVAFAHFLPTLYES